MCFYLNLNRQEDSLIISYFSSVFLFKFKQGEIIYVFREMWTAGDRDSLALLPMGFIPGTIVKGEREGMFPIHKTRRLVVQS